MSRDPYDDRYDTYEYYRQKDDFYRDLDSQHDNFLDDLEYQRKQAEWRRKKARECFENDDLVGGLHFSGYQGDLSSIGESSYQPIVPESDPKTELDRMMTEGSQLFREKSDAAAERVFTQVIERWPSFRPAYSYRGFTRYYQRKYHEAIDDLSSVVTSGSEVPIHVYLTRAHSYYASGQFKEALEDYDVCLSRGEDNERIRLNRARCLMVAKKWALAIEDCDRAIASQPDNARAYYLRADAKLSAGDHNGAERDIEKSIQLDPDNPMGYYVRGMLRNDQNRHEQAIADFRMCYRIEPEWATPMLLIGDSYLKLKEFKNAIDAYQQAETQFANQGNQRMKQVASKALQKVFRI